MPSAAFPLRAEEAQPRALNVSASERLSEDIAIILAALENHPLCLREIINLMQQRAYSFVLIFLSLPFCTPIPLPGVSTPLGVMIAIIGFRLSFGQTLWLPKYFLDVILPSNFLKKIFKAAKGIISFLEYFLRPRFRWMFKIPFIKNLCGVMIMIAGAFLILPFPIPFSGLIPALTVVLLAAAILGNDGFFILAGIVAFVLMLAFFIVLFLGGASATIWLEKWIVRSVMGFFGK